jgi:hypothetical protein
VLPLLLLTIEAVIQGSGGLMWEIARTQLLLTIIIISSIIVIGIEIATGKMSECMPEKREKKKKSPMEREFVRSGSWLTMIHHAIIDNGGKGKIENQCTRNMKVKTTFLLYSLLFLISLHQVLVIVYAIMS